MRSVLRKSCPLTVCSVGPARWLRPTHRLPPGNSPAQGAGPRESHRVLLPGGAEPHRPAQRWGAEAMMPRCVRTQAPSSGVPCGHASLAAQRRGLRRCAHVRSTSALTALPSGPMCEVWKGLSTRRPGGGRCRRVSLRGHLGASFGPHLGDWQYGAQKSPCSRPGLPHLLHRHNPLFLLLSGWVGGCQWWRRSSGWTAVRAAGRARPRAAAVRPVAGREGMRGRGGVDGQQTHNESGGFVEPAAG